MVKKVQKSLVPPVKLIITATNRKNALSSSVSRIVQKIYKKLGEKSEILDLREIPFRDIVEDPFPSSPLPSLQPYLNRIAKAEGLIIVCPEYNGGIPGLIKHFIDHWIYPDSFVYKPICFIGLGGKFGAFNPIAHLQSIFLYRYSFVFPVRVFIQNISQILKEDQIQDENINSLLFKQAENFTKFIQALKTQSFN